MSYRQEAGRDGGLARGRGIEAVSKDVYLAVNALTPLGF